MPLPATGGPPVGTLALLAVACLGASVLLTGLLRRYAVRRQVLDTPNERSSHTVPTPRGGGAAIVLAFGIAGGIAAGLGLVALRPFLTLGLGTAVIAAIGWLDDTSQLRPRTRFTGQIIVAVWTVAMLGGMPAVQIGIGTIPLGLVGSVLAVVGIIWSINLFNFMDGIDGLAGSQATLIFGTAALLLYMKGAGSLGTLSMILAAGSLGFLAWNWPPARIFMGDVGSGAIGYLIAALAIASENSGAVPILVFALIGGVFIVDATVTLIRRVSRGHSPATAHKDHAYQRLSRAWAAHRPVTLGAVACTTLLAVLGALAVAQPLFVIPALAAGWGTLFVFLWVIERRHPMVK